MINSYISFSSFWGLVLPTWSVPSSSHSHTADRYVQLIYIRSRALEWSYIWTTRSFDLRWFAVCSRCSVPFSAVQNTHWYTTGMMRQRNAMLLRVARGVAEDLSVAFHKSHRALLLRASSNELPNLFVRSCEFQQLIRRCTRPGILRVCMCISISSPRRVLSLPNVRQSKRCRGSWVFFLTNLSYCNMGWNIPGMCCCVHRNTFLKLLGREKMKEFRNVCVCVSSGRFWMNSPSNIAGPFDLLRVLINDPLDARASVGRVSS